MEGTYRRWLVAIALALLAGLGVWLVARSRHGAERLAGPGAVGPGGDGGTSLALAPDPITSEESAPDRSDATSAAAVASNGATLRGRVVRAGPTETDLAVPDAIARISPHPDPRRSYSYKMQLDRTPPAPAIAPREVRTDPEGRFEIAGVPLEQYFLLEIDAPAAALAGSVLSFDAMELDDNGAKDLGDIRLWPAMTLQVLVTDESEVPVDGARVSLFLGFGDDDSERNWERTLADQGSGLYSLDRIPEREGSVHVAAPGFVSTEEAFEVPLVEAVVVELERGRRIEGRVLSADGEPIPRATVTCDEYSDWSEDQTETDAEGRFRFDHCYNSYSDLQATAEGYTQGIAPQNPDIDQVEIRLFRATTIAGTVLAAESGKPLSDAEVLFVDANSEAWNDSTASRRVTDAHGRFQLNKAPNGNWRVEADADGYLPGGTLVTIAELQPVSGVVLRLGKGLQLTGQAVDAATEMPVAGVDVILQYDGDAMLSFARSARTEANGDFVVTGLARGPCTVIVDRDGFLEQRLSVDIGEVQPEPLTIRLERAGAISGIVLDDHDRPIELVHVARSFAPGENQQGRRTTRTRKDGSFVLTGTPTSATYTLTIDQSGFLKTEAQGIQVDPGRDAEGLVIRLARGATIRGAVRHADGRPAEDVQVWIEHEGQDNRGSGSQADGTFEIRGVSPGTHRLFAQSEQGVPTPARVLEIGADETLDGTEIVLPGGVPLAGRVVHASGEPAPDVTVEVHAGSNGLSTRTDDAGVFNLGPLPAGRAVIEAGNRDDSAWVAVELPALDVTLRLSSTFVLRGRLVAPDRERLPRGTISVERWANGISIAWQDVSTDDTGRFALRTGPGKLLFVPSLSGYANVTHVGVAAPGDQKDLLIPLLPAGSVEVSAFSQSSGEAVKEFDVVVEPDQLCCPLVLNGHSDDGTAKIDDAIPAGTVSIHASSEAHGHGSLHNVRIEAGQTTRVEVRLARRTGISGEISLAGEPVVGALVTLEAAGFQRSTTTRASGAYAFLDVPAGTHEVVVRPNGREAMARRRVTVEAEEMLDADIDLGLVSLSVHVRRQGKPVAGVVVSAHWAGPGFQAGGEKTDSQGELTLEVPAGVEAELTVAADGKELHRTTIDIPTSGEVLREIELEP